MPAKVLDQLVTRRGWSYRAGMRPVATTVTIEPASEPVGPPKNGVSARKGLFLVLISLLCARAIMVLSVIPPFEAWDEYQHVAYIEHILTLHAAPTLNDTSKDLPTRATIPNAVLASVIAFPQPQGVTQLLAVGGVEYQTYWTLREANQAPRLRRPHPPVLLYEAQHPSLYYRLMAPIFQVAGGLDDLRNSVSAVRAVDATMWVATFALLAWLSTRLFADVRYAWLLSIWLAFQPLLLINSARVANDPLAIFLGTLVLNWCFLFGKRRVFLQSIGLGVVLGLSIWAKTINLALLPFVMVSLALTAWERKWKPGVAVAAGGIILLVVALVTAKYFYFNLIHFHMLTPMGEAVVNRKHGKGAMDLLTFFHGDHGLYWWMHAWWQWWALDSLWIGGWSFFRFDLIVGMVYAGILAIGLAGWLIGAFTKSRQRNPIFAPRFTFIRCLTVCVCLSLALSYHCLQCLLLYSPGLGTSNPTPPWYAAIGTPFFLMLVVGGFANFEIVPQLRFLGLIGPLIYLPIETLGVWTKLLPFYGSTHHISLALARVATLHPMWLRTPTFLLSWIAIPVLACISISLWIRIARLDLGAP
jgi:hypothetical protein